MKIHQKVFQDSSSLEESMICMKKHIHRKIHWNTYWWIFQVLMDYQHHYSSSTYSCVLKYFTICYLQIILLYVNKYKLLYFSTNTQKCHHSKCLSELHSSSHPSIYRFIHPSIITSIHPSIHPSFHQSFDLWLK